MTSRDIVQDGSEYDRTLKRSSRDAKNSGRQTYGSDFFLRRLTCEKGLVSAGTGYIRYAKCKRTAFAREFHSRCAIEWLIVEQTRTSGRSAARPRSLALRLLLNDCTRRGVLGTELRYIGMHCRIAGCKDETRETFRDLRSKQSLTYLTSLQVQA